MTAPTSESAREGRSARSVLFAYHEMGYACMGELLAMGAPIAALFTHRDDPDEQIWWRSCAELARRHSIPVFFDETIEPVLLEKIAAAKPAIIYSFFYRRLLPEQLLKLAPLGAFNMHGALLPKYRGRASVNWMLINGEREAGVTLHHMVARADAGDIVAQRAVAITDDDTALSVYQKIVPLAAALVREYHPLIAAGSAPRRTQDLTAGSYFGRRRPQDGRIDWHWPARRIANLVRGVTHPYPGAFCFADGRKLMIWQARLANENGEHGAPGSIIGLGPDSAVEVAAGAGTVAVIRAQFEGAIEAPASELLAGAAFRLRLE
ncbi:MAG TPA: formyltransferase [Candidatus Binataceae bacterium]|nr:formyltransferase [Candidatus Binataceae bacterium]